jgi:hypothetical protein
MLHLLHEVILLFSLNIIVLLSRLLGKLVYLARLSNCIIASLYVLNSLMI